MKLPVVLSTLLMVAGAHVSFGQTPTITGLQPESGPVGTPVTISGTRFGTDPANVQVFFGTLPAVVTSVTPEAITTTVPAGAAYELVVVRLKNSSRTVYSPRPFIVTFESERDIRPAYFLSKVDLTVGAGTNPRNLAAGDIDGDGNIDLVTANLGTKTISIFRNLRTGSGPVTAETFAVPVNFVADEISTVTLADLDGDGKPEIIGTNLTYGKLIVFKNTSTPGVIDANSFQAKIEWATGGDSAYGIAIGDLNSDGKPEIVVPSAVYGRVLVYQNDIYNNQITSGSFSKVVALQIFPEISTFRLRDVTLGDVDGDGEPDIVVAAIGVGDEMAVVRNLGGSSISTASFAEPVFFVPGTGPTSVALADTDRNGVLDIVTANWNSYTVGLSLNRNVPGSLSETLFGRQEYNIGAQPAKLVIADFDGDGFPDAATANNSTTRSIAVFENSNVPGYPLTNVFFTRADLAVGAAPTGLVAADLNGDGKPDLATVNGTVGTLSIFINNNARVTPPPVITSFTPDNGNFRDEVVITGQNFNGRPTNNLVKFNGVIAKVLVASTTSLTVEVPEFVTTGKITVQVSGYETATSTKDFQVFQIPAVTGFEPMQGPVGTSVTIHGANFSSTPADNVVYFGAVRAVVTAATATALTVTVPTGATYKPLSVAVHAMVAYSDKPFTVTFPGGKFTPAMFPSRRIFASGIKFPKDAALGDIDDDGKTDIAMTGSSGGVVLFRNTSATGSTTFATPYTLPGIATTSSTGQVELEDLDLDGKLDLIVYQSGYVKFSKNLSTSGSLLFAAPVTILARTGASSFTIADMDLDGKPDLVHSDSYSVGVARNTSIRGKALSFATSVQYYLPADTWHVAVTDVDGDGKPDIVYPTYDDYFAIVAVLQNKSVPMTIDESSFAPYVPFRVIVTPQALALADYDGDGKTDIAASCYSGGGREALALLQNTSISGDISSGSFAPSTYWDTPSAAYAVRAADLDGDGRVEIAKPTCGTVYCNVSIFRNIGSPGTPLASCFETRKDVGQMADQEILEIADLNGDGRPELITANDNTGDLYDLVVLENKPTAPVITNFTPTSGPVGTVVTITGTNFNTTASLNTVSFNGVPASVTKATAASLTAVVPDDAETGFIIVSANDQMIISTTPFTVTRLAQSIAFTLASSVKIDQEPITLTATASSALNVTYTSSNPEVATVTDNVVTLVAGGITTITASQPGNKYYAPAEAVSHALTVEKLGQTISFDALPGKTTGDEPFTLTATASSELPVAYTSSNPDVAEVSDNEVQLIAAGTTIITAWQAGNAWFSEAVAVEQQLIVQKSAVITGTDPEVAKTSLVAPNPVSTWAVIALGNASGASAVSVRLFDGNGRLVNTRNFTAGEERKLDLSAFPNGLYSIDVTSNTAHYTARFAVMH